MIAIAPPNRQFRLARHWDTFVELFDPVIRRDHSVVWDTADISGMDVPANRIWTIVEGDSGALYLLAGYRRVNRVGYLITTNLWAGEADAHPTYLYATPTERT